MSWGPQPGAGANAADMPPGPGGNVFADFFDGRRALRQRVAVTLGPDRLLLELPSGARQAWPLRGLRAAPDQADRTTLVLSQAGDPVPRLVLADAELVARIRALAPNLRRRPPVENWGRIGTWAAGAVASVVLIIFVLVPTLADQLAQWLPPEGEKALGDATYEQIRTALSDSFVPVEACTGGEGLVALAAMQARLNAAKDLPYPVEITVLDHDLVNAFALPGGRIVMFRGLLEEAANPDEVAAVLAHEIGHVVGRDPTRDALRLAGSVGVLGLLFGDFAGGTVVLLLANELINAQYSQKAEAGADDYAHALLTAADLPPAALGTFFERLRDEYGDAEGLAAHFASHPQMTARIEAALAAQAEAERAGHVGPPALDAAQWQALQGICGAGSSRGGVRGEAGANGAASGGASAPSGAPGKLGGKVGGKVGGETR